MSGKICGLVWDYDLPHNEAWVLMAVADHADHSGRNAFPGVRLLAWKTGYEERQVRRILKRLEARGALVPQNRGRAGTVTTYAIDLSRLTLKPTRKQDKKSGSTGHLAAPEPDISTTINRTFEPFEPDISGRGKEVTVMEPSMNRPAHSARARGSRFDLGTCERYGATLPWVQNPRGFAKSIRDSGEDDEKIAAWLKDITDSRLAGIDGAIARAAAQEGLPVEEIEKEFRLAAQEIRRWGEQGS